MNLSAINVSGHGPDDDGDAKGQRSSFHDGIGSTYRAGVGPPNPPPPPLSPPYLQFVAQLTMLVSQSSQLQCRAGDGYEKRWSSSSDRLRRCHSETPAKSTAEQHATHRTPSTHPTWPSPGWFFFIRKRQPSIRWLSLWCQMNPSLIKTAASSQPSGRVLKSGIIWVKSTERLLLTVAIDEQNQSDGIQHRQVSRLNSVHSNDQWRPVYSHSSFGYCPFKTLCPSNVLIFF